jgi:hypothetical protein
MFSVREVHVLRALTMIFLLWVMRSIFWVTTTTTTSTGHNVYQKQTPITTSSNTASTATTQRPRPKMTLFVRMSGSLPSHRNRFYCTFFRSTALFWNVALTNRIVLVLDDEVSTDHDFGTVLSEQVATEFPEFDLHIKYEPLPQDKLLLSVKSGQSKRTVGYRRQLYSTFLTDQFLDDDATGDDDTLIVFMDNDAMFFSPVTLSSILDESRRPRVLGTDCTHGTSHVQEWAVALQAILGFPMISDFMSYFPVYIYADTIRQCRAYIIQRFGGTTWDEIYPKISPPGRGWSPICVLMSYAWYFERDRYNWSFEVCGYPSKRNGAIGTKNLQHYMSPNDVTETLPVPQTAFHQPYSLYESKVAHRTYSFDLLENNNAGNDASRQAKSSPLLLFEVHVPELTPDCSLDLHRPSVLKYTVQDLYVLFVPNLQFLYDTSLYQPPRCKGANEFDCIDRLEKHFQSYVYEVQKEGRPPLDWSRTERVTDMARQAWDITCSSLLDPKP